MTKILVALLVSVFIVSAANAEDPFSLKWSYNADGEISVLNSGDINSDGFNEVVFSSETPSRNFEGNAFESSGNNLYVLDKDGNLKQSYRINSTGSISAIDIADFDDDNKNEIILGTGWMERTNVNEESFNISGLTMFEREKKLIKTLRNRGAIYLIDDGIVSKLHDVDGWVRSIDISNEGIVTGTGGYNTDYFEEIVYDSNGAKRRNYTDYSSWGGSIIIFNKTGLNREYKGNNAFYSVSVYDIQGDPENEIIAGSGNNVYAFDKNLTILWKYIAIGAVKNLYAGYLDDRYEKRIISDFMSNNIDGIHVLNGNGMQIWTYRLPVQSKLSGFSIGNLDAERDNEMWLRANGSQTYVGEALPLRHILVADKNNIYILDHSGRLRLEYGIAGGIDKIYLTDLDADGYMDLIISSKNTVTVYEVTEILIKRQAADRYYESAKEFYDSRNYESAKGYAKNASDIYIEINDRGGISRADLLYYKILEGSKGDRRREANSLYASALSHYGFNDYAMAMNYAKNASDVYIEINDMGGISMTNTLIMAIKNKIVNITGETTAINVQTNATYDKIHEISDFPIIIVFLVIVIAVLIVLIVIRTRKPED